MSLLPSSPHHGVQARARVVEGWGGVYVRAHDQRKGHMVVTMTAAMMWHCVVITVITMPWGKGKGQGGEGLGWGVCQGQGQGQGSGTMVAHGHDNDGDDDSVNVIVVVVITSWGEGKVKERARVVVMRQWQKCMVIAGLGRGAKDNAATVRDTAIHSSYYFLPYISLFGMLGRYTTCSPCTCTFLQSITYDWR